MTTPSAPSLRPTNELPTYGLPRVGVSRCLLGENVRVNGGHCRNRWILDVLARGAEFVGICPEVELGMPVPRPPLRLAITDDSEDAHDARLVESRTGEEWTERMAAHARRRAEELAGMNLHGFILKKDSPTCGLWRVKVYDRNDSPTRRGRGVFADALASRLPNLPVEEEGRLNDPALRESFLIRVHAYAAWTRFLADDGSDAGLMAFHARHKMLLLAADPGAYRHLGRLVGGHVPGLRSGPERLAHYEQGLMHALSQSVSRGRHMNVLQHLLGFCKTRMDESEKRELARVLGLYAEGVVARAVPIALVRYLLIKHGASAWAVQQAYLEPYAPELEREQRA